MGKKRAPKGPSEQTTSAPGAAAPRDRKRLAIGIALMVLGFGGTFLMMSNEGRLPHGPLFGMFSMLLGTAGLLETLGLFRGPIEGRIDLRSTALFATEGEPVFLSPLVTAPLAVLVMVVGAFAGGYDGLPITIVAALACLLPSAIRRPGLMVAVVAAGLFLPFLGVYGLWDPWETHYGEVAREILARDDWVSLWWAQEDWFWSKPILIFWIEALSMGALGVDFMPDANPLHPEWAIRLPHFFLATGALLSVYALVKKVWSERAGLVTAVVLATMPHFFFLAHQAITDMPFVSNMTMAMCMFGLAISTDPEREVKRYALGPLTISGRHLLIGAITMVVVPQILYLFSRNVTFLGSFPAAFGWHGDLFMSGSAGNHGVPGNSPVHNVEPFLSGPGAQPAAQALVWLAGFLGILAMLRNEKRSRHLFMFAFYLFCGLAFMAKGIPGFALPGLIALFFLIGTKRWDFLLKGQLRVGAGILTVLTVGMPWYVAMYIRHGPPFTNRLLVHDHLNRLTAGVHMDESRPGSIGYFVEQMGHGMFPWIALAPIALAAWLLSRGDKDESPTGIDRRQIIVLASLWLLSAFVLFSAMTTKFHHYIFPAVPPTALLVGVAVDRLLGKDGAKGFDLSRIGAAALAVLAPLPAVLGVAGRWGDVRGVVPEGLTGAAATSWVVDHPWSMGASVGLLALAAAMFAGAVWLLRDRTENEKADTGAWSPWARGAMTTGLLAAPPVLALIGRDLSWVTDARPQGYERLIHLFVYNYARPWPEEFDYRPVLTGFAVVATLTVLLAAIRPLRGVAMRTFLGVALLFSVWSLDVYLIDLSPHWGQRELVQRYYDTRASADEPLVAWQMNWKGENFYSGNHVNVFVQLDNNALRTWLGENEGRTAYFLLEHARLNSLRGVMRDSTLEEVTDTRLCNKFVLVRAHIGERAPEVRETRD